MSAIRHFTWAMLALIAAATCVASDIRSSKHNLSASGQGSLTANLSATDTHGEICIFCHTPHSAGKQPALWNRYESGVIYTPYSSSTLKASVGQPTGASKLCLSCHDGTVALGMIRSRSTRIQMKGATTMPPGRSNLGTDLSDDHPISFKYDAALVAANACENCHDPHGAGGKQRLLNCAAEEENCFACHNGNVAAKNIQAEFNQTSVHPVLDTFGVHDPMETPLVPSGASRHIKCADCHNPHAVNHTSGTTVGGASGALNRVRGISGSGASVPQIMYEYELCFRCHADTAKGPSRVSR